ncbi:MAG: AsmA family protein [Steroidobacteraceae bacterium]
MRVFKIAAWVLGGIVALVVVGIALIALFFDPNDYKADIEKLVTDKTGRSFTLNGDLKLSVFPWLAVQVGPAALGNAAGFGDTPMVSIEGAKLGVKLRPLFSGRFEIGEVQLDTPRIVLIKASADSNNWSDIGSKEVSAPANESTTTSGKLDASVASITIKNGFISYDDREAGVQTQLSKFELSTGKLEPGQPFDLQSSFTAQRGADLLVDSKFAANITADTDAERYQLLKPDITLLVKGAGYPKDGLSVNLQAGNIVADVAAQTAQISALAMDAAGAKLTADLQATQIVDAPKVTGTIKLAQISLREFAPKFGITLPVTSDAKVLQKFSMEAGINASTTAAELKPFTMHLDDSTMTGSAGVADFETMALRFDLAVDSITVDRYLPPAEPEKAAATTTPTDTGPTPIPVDTIRGLNMRGKLAIQNTSYKNMQLSKLNVGVDATNGKLQLDPLQASLYEGKYRGNVLVDASGKLPRLSLEQHLEGINFAPLLEALYKNKRLSGRGSVNMKLAGNGADSDAIKKTLGGTLDFSVADGAVNGFDLWYEIRRARALLKQQTIPTRTGPEQTNFTSLKGSATVVDGQLNNKDLIAALQYLKVTGQGGINLVNSSIDYKLAADVLKIPAEDKMVEQTQDIVGLSIPVRITGSISDPKVRPDVEGLIKEKAKQRIEEEKEKVIEKAKDKLQDKLKGLFGGK